MVPRIRHHVISSLNERFVNTAIAPIMGIAERPGLPIGTDPPNTGDYTICTAVDARAFLTYPTGNFAEIIGMRCDTVIAGWLPGARERPCHRSSAG